MRGVNSSYELLRTNMKKNKKQFNTGKPTKHRKGRSISPSPDRFAIIRSLIRGKPKVLPFIQGQANYIYNVRHKASNDNIQPRERWRTLAVSSAARYIIERTLLRWINGLVMSSFMAWFRNSLKLRCLFLCCGRSTGRPNSSLVMRVNIHGLPRG
jgi:hypothetical protein